ncbi:surface carbohydrate biosynthesis protein [Flavobacterium sp. 28A]|uniref:surface carbohydrate biosynthesis protein n=1 Tax=Flavobacterium sp. 28A TaxID=2735895 RepID=UPI00156F39E6|nr:surface carbohydrate biosynthesis protein [Flavobacterium sp. 28A]NRT15107.1 surface carbohydrate biosynthesis protein [Flavobacterium sp. 28A]
MNILLPIETINREIDFKIVLAGLLADSNNTIYLGQHDFLMKILPKFKNGGIYVGKNIFNKRADIEKGEKYHLLKKFGFDIVYLHEEGGVFAGDKNNWITVLKSQYNIDYFDENDAVCVWGDFQNKVDTDRNIKGKVPVITTGHPRFDLCKEKWHFIQDSKIENIKSMYGDFVLINGNYGLANHGLGIDYVFSDKGNYNVVNEVERLKRVDFFSYSSKQLLSMIQLTHYLAIKFPDLNFIYRPHPSENHSYYKTVFSGVKNIIVSHDGPILPWILASQAIIHDGCTTAIEAALSGVPVINYKPESNLETDIWLPNQMGVKAASIDQVVEHVHNAINGKINVPFESNPNQNAISEILYNFKGDSFEALLNVIDTKISGKKETPHATINSTAVSITYYKSILKSIVYPILKPKKAKELQYHATKFYGIDEKEFNDKIKKIANILDKNISVKYHNSKLIEIN